VGKQRDTVELVRDTGEFDLIDRLRDALPGQVRDGAAIRLGIGDDAAVFDVPAGESLVVTTDAMVEGRHFRFDWTDWEQLGHKLLAVNLSDLAAMGATPRVATVTLGLTGNEPVARLVEMYRGLGNLAKWANIAIAGGDVVRSEQGMFCDLTAIGSGAADSLIRRAGPRLGNLVVVSGYLGAAAAGLELLQGNNRGARSAGVLIEALLRPVPRLHLGLQLAAAGVTSGMDLSDGLYGDLVKLLRRSGVAAEIEMEKVPVAAAVRALFPDRWFELATRGGEDYELLLTIPPDRLDDLCRAGEDTGSTITVIGRIIEGEPGTIVEVDDGGNRHPVKPGAFDHFA